MSYCRQPYYIYPNINGTVIFDIFGDIPDEVVNIFLYKLYNFRNDEFIERTELGRKALDEWNESIKEDNFLTLQQIQEKNRTETALLGSEITQQEYSDELVNQCKEEFETFVKPIRNDGVNRYIQALNNTPIEVLKEMENNIESEED
ncbi:hypothetical protein [Clostridium beijerinckii]|uniref:hypothetical protein n=1 Tax=Clostridium beijerinckii TaxID=1520 RepID=UPI0015706709|nr:hypothetical protein [Clostridium beijerinckii]NRU52418.1 hypothetical protein [Clostridium beijerinckii]NYC69137.1 hypothetical protein [Clostridium beijerinckii]NYC91909.1 hypothetical protein [Clostridium beijerinckii]